MPETTPTLALPLIAAGQAQKHVTHNEALIQLDALVQLACRDKDLGAPPASPAEGDRYLVLSAGPTGACPARSPSSRTGAGGASRRNRAGSPGSSTRTNSTSSRRPDGSGSAAPSGSSRP